MSVARLAVPLLLLTAPLAAQMPDTFQNLQVFPKDIKKGELLEEMKRFSFGTGLRCEHCHVGKGGAGLEAMDWAEDTDRKRTTRAMIKMVRAINDGHIAPLGRKGVAVTCATCHHGLAKPIQLDTLVLTAVREKGVDAAVATYRDLRKRYYGGAAYDFGEKTLNLAAQQLLAEGRAKDAVALVELNLEHGAKEAWTHAMLSDARLAAGDRAGAISAVKKALEIDPKLDWARKKLDQLEKAP